MTNEPFDPGSNGVDSLIVAHVPQPRIHQPRAPEIVRPLSPYTTVQIGRAVLARLDLPQAVEHVLHLAGQPRASLVVTANSDHIVRLNSDDDLAAAYAAADLALVDGQPLAWTSSLMSLPTPRITGIDLFAEICQQADDRIRLYLLGGSEPNSFRAAEILEERHPNLHIVGRNTQWADDHNTSSIIEKIRAAGPNVVAVFYGCPKQEKWVNRNLSELPSGAYLCLGGTVDIISGALPRAGRLWQTLGLEWLYRLLLEPRRLWRRYLVDDPKYLVIAGKSIYRHRRNRRS